MTTKIYEGHISFKVYQEGTVEVYATSEEDARNQISDKLIESVEELEIIGLKIKAELPDNVQASDLSPTKTIN